MNFVYANEDHSTIINEKNGVVFITFPKLVKAGICHGFSTRIGGVSEGHLSSMNLSFTRGDDPEKVQENFRRIGAAIGFDAKDLVLSSQIHETEIRKVTAKDKGDGIVRETVSGIDALVTDEAGIPMYTSYADCVPLLFYDSEHHVAGMAHSGWRGTVHKMGQATLDAMHERFGTEAKDVIAAVGPSICQDCYEVSGDVIEEFRAAFPETLHEKLFYGKPDGKYQLNLWEANHQILLTAGVPEKQIHLPNLCTCCNPDFLYSHRASKGKRGNLAAFLSLV